MADRPILFSGAMVRALLEGRKTQTRRLLSIRRAAGFTEFAPTDTEGFDWQFRDRHARWHDLTHDQLLQRLPWQKGDHLWVRETWGLVGAFADMSAAEIRTYPEKWLLAKDLCFRADDHVYDRAVRGYRSAIHMYEWMSRLTLVVKDVRVQRLLDISEEDALAEGIYREELTDEARAVGCTEADRAFVAPGTKRGYGGREERNLERWGVNARLAYRELWNSINEKREGGKYRWCKSPWVVALTFDVHQKNIKQMEAA